MITLLEIIAIYILIIIFFGIRYDRKHNNNYNQYKPTMLTGYGSVDRNNHIHNGFGV
jgi:hypothetical protein